MGILNKTVILKTAGSMSEYYYKKGYLQNNWYIDNNGKKCFKKGVEFEVNIEDISKTSTALIDVVCDFCGKNKTTKYSNISPYLKHDGLYYCRTCSNKLRKKEPSIQTRIDKSGSLYDWLIKHNQNDIIERFDYVKTGKSLSDLTIHSHTHIYLKCPNGKHDSEAKNISNFIKGHEKSIDCIACKSFAEYIKLTHGINSIDLLWSDKNTISPYSIYAHSNKYVWIKCKNNIHEDFKIQPNNAHITNLNCPQCSIKYRGEEKIKEYLLKNNIKYEPQKTFFDLRSDKNAMLSYDFFLNDYNLLIEFQGKQHLEETPIFHKKEGDFLKQLKHDVYKYKYALKNKYNLGIIWFFDIKRIEEMLDMYIRDILCPSPVLESEKMKFIYAFTPECKKWLIDNNFKKITTTIINDEEVDIYSNQKNVIIPDELKYKDLMWSNKLMF